ncbi:hypothetical protein [Porphyrobacter sp. AAP60]|uniref:hypothetical protein n=1 Tax=Porphyrobacter sp. AAP60 TaxID=1523423 RepID=UPI0012E1CDC2|nr:hypothetical protein [Porphyrobacter sp. AAP60]
MTEPPFPPQAPPIHAEAEVPTHLPMEQRADGTLVIDLRPLAHAAQECAPEVPDPFNREIVVCNRTSYSPRIGPLVGPVDDGFASAIPRARLKLSDKAAAEANLINKGVGGWNANGGEVRLKIDF